MTRRLLLLVLVPCLLIAGCGGDDDDAATAGSSSANDALACDDVYAEGAEIVESTLNETCEEADGSLLALGSSVTECTDGRTLVYNDRGWGYVGETWQGYEPGAEQVAPAAARDACEG